MNSPSGELRTLRDALGEQYTIERELGRGGMGVVFLARDLRLDRLVALKVLPAHLAGQSDTSERFLREARTAAQLSHPHIVPIYRADELAGMAFFAMGFVDGETLADRLLNRGPLVPAEVVRTLREVAWALAYAHARGIVHRDIKPENILLERTTGRAVVTDFGIARTTFDPSITQAGHVLGTVHYMSPEQCAGGTLDGRSDLYALGVVGFYALSGRLPFEGDSAEAIIVAHATKNPPPLQSYAAEVPASLAAVIDCLLAKDPADRFPTGEALADALAKAMESVPLSARSANAERMNTGQAEAIWRRAAQLQAEAASRLELRVRGTGLGPETRAMLAYSGDSGDTAPAATEEKPDAAGLRAHDVEAAAVEAGISQQYVALAMAELSTVAGTSIAPADGSDWQESVATRLFGSSKRSLAVSRLFRFAPRVVLAALGRTLQASPYSLELRDTIGGHPLDGGVLVFALPNMSTSDYRWTWLRYGAYVKQLRVTLALLPGNPRACDVTVHCDLREGLLANFVGVGAAAGGVATGGALASGAIAMKAFALSGLALAAPIVGVAAALGLGALASAGALYRWEIRKATAEIEKALAAVETSIKAFDVFGDTNSAPRALGERAAYSPASHFPVK